MPHAGSDLPALSLTKCNRCAVVDIAASVRQDAVQAIQPIGSAQVSENSGLAVVGDVLAGAIPQLEDGGYCCFVHVLL
ncbi:MAG TPA: hypothetical protein PLC47_04650, partial [Bacteroidales bacterium]|nr:hypothetical protein [Bacteroidales bacterium]